MYHDVMYYKYEKHNILSVLMLFVIAPHPSKSAVIRTMRLCPSIHLKLLIEKIKFYVSGG